MRSRTWITHLFPTCLSAERLCSFARREWHAYRFAEYLKDDQRHVTVLVEVQDGASLVTEWRKTMPAQDILVSTRWLAEHLDDDGLRVVDVRWSPDDVSYGAHAYAQGHIPGAVYLGPQVRVATPEHFRQSVETAGIDDTISVIAYDDGGPFHAARLVWSLHYLGHPAAYVLDGGFREWSREGRPLETKVVVPPLGRLTLAARPDLRATKAAVLRVLSEQTNVQIVDCHRGRSWEDVRQHIPGARHLPSTAAFTAEGTWKSPDALRRVAAEAGLALERPAVLYCGGGLSAACVYVILKVLGADQVAVYDASWREWGSDPTTPKEPH